MSVVALSPVWLVDDIPATTEFYCAKLGFKLTDFQEDYAEVESGYASIRFILAETKGARNSVNSVDNGNFADAYLLVEGVYKLYEDYCAKSLTLDGEPIDAGYGMVDFILTDCNGYRLCMGEALKDLPRSIKPAKGHR